MMHRTKVCRIAGCPKPVCTKGFCAAHYTAYRRKDKDYRLKENRKQRLKSSKLYRTDSKFKEACKLKSRETTRSVKLEVMLHYCGGKLRCMCAGCFVHGPKFLKFLVMDHIAGGGKKKRAPRGYILGGLSLYRWLKKMGYPKGFQVLCCACNNSKHDDRGCKEEGQPH